MDLQDQHSTPQETELRDSLAKLEIILKSGLKLSQYQEAELRDTSTFLHCNLGNLLREQGEPQAAIQAYQEGIRAWHGSNPQEAYHKFTFAILHLELGGSLEQQDKQAVIKVYQEGIRAWHGSIPQEFSHRHILASLHYNLGFFLNRQGYLQEAIQHFQEGIQSWQGATPQEAEHRNRLASLVWDIN